MIKSNAFFIISILFPLFLFAQNNKIDVDSLFNEAQQLYKDKHYIPALELTNNAILIAPEYTDIRLLQIRIEQETNQLEASEKDILYLLNNSKTECTPLALRQMLLYERITDLNDYRNTISGFLDNTIDFVLTKAEAFLNLNDKKTAKSSLQNLKDKSLNSIQNYRLQDLKKQISVNQISLNYELISFSKDYPSYESWHVVGLDYMRYFGKQAVTARVIYNDRGTNEGMLYEIDAYPVFSKKWYSYISLNTSDADFFQNFGGSLSVYYSIENIIEIEAGFRYLEFETQSFFTPVIGATKYVGQFYINGRAFIGPEKDGKLIQNYQLNTRFYLKTPGDYLFLRLGTGISPDDRSRFTQIANNPDLVAKYINLGVNKWIKSYGITLSTGYLNEDLANGLKGNQIVCNVGLKYRF
ncbi:YaiO family outer membrane beta-barrel protein [Lacinutrix sp. Hel_I_90]|uniref:YaiO family outer membrane beta-barrel protein n=1 Tax=Lacinutrix sp. Hel_I_90 TaxID=1249999 RepID=UPI0005CAD865|nr:YaiO family outer membrane beta-barrel protein [Lacinutrix sp. Hel_I_90]